LYLTIEELGSLCWIIDDEIVDVVVVYNISDVALLHFFFSFNTVWVHQPRIVISVSD